MAAYRILAFDGGGVRLALAAQLLVRLTRKIPELIDETDLLVGTSSGACMALGLASGLTPREVSREIISEPAFAQLFADKNPFPAPFTTPLYDLDNFREFLESLYAPDLRLKDLEHRVIAVSFEEVGGPENAWRPVFFNNFPKSETRRTSVIDTALASGAAPIFYASADKFLDGGLIANNPSLVGITFGVDRRAADQELSDIAMLSFGWGFFPLQIAQSTDNWGALQWFGVPGFYTPGPKEPQVPLQELMVSGVSDKDTLFSTQLLGERYHRLNPRLPRRVAVDDLTAVSELKAFAETVDLAPTIAYIRRHWLGE